MKYDVIIIGSGLGGLACAHILSKAGKNMRRRTKRFFYLCLNEA